MRIAATLGRLETMAAATAGNGIGVEDGEARAHQAVHVVDLGTLEVPRGETVDDDPEAFDLTDDVIIEGRVVKGHPVGRATAAWKQFKKGGDEHGARSSRFGTTLAISAA